MENNVLIITILILCISHAISLVGAYHFYNKFEKEKSENILLIKKHEKIKKESNNKFKVGDLITSTLNLSNIKDKVSFKILYELKIIEISEKEVKVSYINHVFLETQHPKFNNAVNGFIENKWIDKKDANLIQCKSKRRAEKIKKILSKNENKN